MAAFTAEVNSTVSGETIDSSSTQNVNSGGVAISSTLQNNSVQNVFAGGSASATIVGNFWVSVCQTVALLMVRK